MKVAIATASLEKIKGVKRAFTRYFKIKESELELYAAITPSGVSNQPFNEETYEGALNRVNGIKKVFPDMDFYVSCEAGIESMLDQYFNVQVVCIYNAKKEVFLWGKSAGWTIPNKDIEIIQKSTLDTYLRNKGLTCIEELLGSENSRSLAIAQATELALASGKLL